jgi:hypothetical protein
VVEHLDGTDLIRTQEDSTTVSELGQELRHGASLLLRRCSVLVAATQIKRR